MVVANCNPWETDAAEICESKATLVYMVFQDRQGYIERTCLQREKN